MCIYKMLQYVVVRAARKWNNTFAASTWHAFMLISEAVLAAGVVCCRKLTLRHLQLNPRNVAYECNQWSCVPEW